MDPLHKLRSQLIALRHARELTQAQVAARLQMRQPAFSALETGDAPATLEIVAAWVDALDGRLSVAAKPGKPRVRALPPDAEARLRAIVADVAKREGVAVADVFGPRRARLFARARHLAMREVRAAMPLSLPQIGRAFGRDHTTVIHALKHSRAIR